MSYLLWLVFARLRVQTTPCSGSVSGWWRPLQRSSWPMALPPLPPSKQGFLCSAASQVVFHRPTPGLRQHQFFGFSPSLIPPSFLLPLVRELAGSPDSRVESFHTCYSALTPPQPTTPRHSSVVDMAFPFGIQGPPANLSDFGAHYCACAFPCQRFPISRLVGTIEA
jgi:hypothetical protein